jgi:hypothetical protein
MARPATGWFLGYKARQGVLDGSQTRFPKMKNIHAGRVRFTTIAMLGLLASLMPVCVTSASAESPEARAACTSDAFRLCSNAMPDVARTKACLVQNLRSLSPLCRTAMSGDGGGGHAVRHHRRHH